MNLNSEHTAKAQRASNHKRDVHALPPQHIHDIYKKYQKMKDRDIDLDPEVVDFSRGLNAEQSAKLKTVEPIAAATRVKAFETFLNHKPLDTECAPCTIYEHVEFPGLRLYPNLLPPPVQIALVDRLLHRELSNPLHKTNLHGDYALPYVRDHTSATSSQPVSFFTLPQSDPCIFALPQQPNDKLPSLNLTQFLRRRWRWLTIGTQYDWPTRQYPPQDEVLTSFPSDIAGLISGLFPRVRAESGVVLIYSPKDFMPVHRDVSELCERELCSFSIGCDGLFVVALDYDQNGTAALDSNNINMRDTELDDQDRPLKTTVIRVRSGDMIEMSGLTRWAWHAMPKVMAGTCPDFLRDWPVKPQEQMSENKRKSFENWRGYMGGKRINISCRQVYD